MLGSLVTMILVTAQIFLQEKVILETFQIRCRWWTPVLSAIAIYLLYQMAAYFIPVGEFLIVIYVFLFSLFYILVCKQKVLFGAFLGLLQMLFVTCVEYASQIIWALLGSGIMSVAFRNDFLLARLVNTLLLVGILFVVRWYKIELSRALFTRRLRHIWLVYFMFLLLYTLPNILLYNRDLQQGAPMSGQMYNLLLIAGFCAIHITFSWRFYQNTGLERIVEEQDLYIDSLLSSLEGLRAYKHDYANIVSALSGALAVGDFQLMQQYIDGLKRDIERIQSTDAINESLREIAPLYGILIREMCRAESMNVSLTIRVEHKLDLLYCDPLDYSRMVATMLDNALEAAQQSEQRMVVVQVGDKKGRNQITIRNSCAEPVEVDRICEPEYTTKEGHTGRGMARVRKIVDRYYKQGFDCYLELSYDEDNGICIQTLAL